MIPTPTTTPANRQMGTAVPSDFRLPWNTTRTMADAWRVKDDPPKRISVRPRAKPEPSAAKVPYAGNDRTRYFLRDWQGSYLHESGDGMTRDPKCAWRGTERQLEAMRKKHPNTTDLIASEAA